jgi:hypothetical protein
MRLAVNSHGRLGCIVPSGIATDDTTKFFFQDLIQTHSLVSLFDFENRRNIFPGVGHGKFKFCLLTLTSPINPLNQPAEFVFFAYETTDLSDESRHFTLSEKDIELLNPNTRTCPIFRSKRDAELTKAIYECVPVLIKEGVIEENIWNISFSRMFDMTNDSHLFRNRQQLEAEGWTLKGNIFHKGEEKYLPLYEGKMIWHFDHRFGSYEDLIQEEVISSKLPEFNEEQHRNPYLLPIPRYWVHISHLPEFIYDRQTAHLAFRDITGSVLFRTAVFSIIPVVPCSNKLPVVVLDTKDNVAYNKMYFSACVSSFIFDYIARQKIGGSTMNYFILKQLPVLPSSAYTKICKWKSNISLGKWIFPRALELTYTAWDLEAFAKDCGYNGSPFRWDEERRFLLRCELDAAYFHLYGIARDDVDYIMDTFSIVKRKEEEKYEEYCTKRVILEIYDEMQKAIESGGPYRTWLEPPPADAAMAHAGRGGVEV